MARISVGIIGVTGYAGQELLKILLKHPEVSVQYLAARRVEKARPAEEVVPPLRGLLQTERAAGLRIHPFRVKEATDAAEFLFLALPHGVAMEIVPQIFRKPKAKLVDLSGDFRLKSAEKFLQAYQMKHKRPTLLKESVYGLTEWARDSIRSARLVANPGCYPTAVLLGLAPLAEQGLLEKEGLIVDAKSGVTGAGRSLKEELLFSEVNEDLRAYRVNSHQHMPEMEQELSRLSRRPMRMVFVPHLVPMNRGLYATIYAPLTKALSESEVRSIYRSAYKGEPFIGILPEGIWPQVKSVEGSNRCEIGLKVDRKHRLAILLVAIDNLGKGAAGQAVQNMNLMCGLEETEGLS